MATLDRAQTGAALITRTRPARGTDAPQPPADRLLRAGQHLARAGDPVEHPWIVVVGVLKSYLLHADGEEQVLDFHMPGDIIGLDALLHRQAATSVVALDTCSVRRLAITPPERGARPGRTDADCIIDGMYQEILRLTRRLQMATESTHQRLAGYLLDFSDRQRRRGLKPYDFRLPMRRRDLALYLGLATETLSRTFTRLRKRGLLSVDNYDIRILDPEGLRAVAGRAAPMPASGDESRPPFAGATAAST